jgi:ribosomal protein S27E
MSIDRRSGKAVGNERKYPFIVEVPVAADGLDRELNRQIIGFHKSRRIEPGFGRTAFRDGQTYYRWCFSDGDGACLCRTVWRSVLQSNRLLKQAPPAAFRRLQCYACLMETTLVCRRCAAKARPGAVQCDFCGRLLPTSELGVLNVIVFAFLIGLLIAALIIHFAVP